MIEAKRKSLIAIGVLALAGCAGIRSDEFQEPSVTLESFRIMPSEGIAPRFLIGLRVINPNRSALDLRGLSYDVELEGRKLLTGVAGNLASIPAFGESTIELQAGVDLLSGLRLFNDLISVPGRERVNYTFRARLDVGRLSRLVTIEETGELTLVPGQR